MTEKEKGEFYAVTKRFRLFGGGMSEGEGVNLYKHQNNQLSKKIEITSKTTSQTGPESGSLYLDA